MIIFKVGMVFRTNLNGFKNAKIEIIEIVEAPFTINGVIQNIRFNQLLRIRALGSELNISSTRLQQILERNYKKIKKTNWLKEGF